MMMKETLNTEHGLQLLHQDSVKTQDGLKTGS